MSRGRSILLPLVPVYRGAVALETLSYARGWRRVERLRWPVISIGNLSVGGAGKTPFTILLAQLLKGAGVSVDVLSRGYGRRSREILQVDPEGSAASFGDEPLLIAREAGVPVFVGSSRYDAGRLAERVYDESDAPHVHLLDDGFQHRKLARSLDIVLLHPSDFSEHMLPAGRLREPLSTLRRADVVMLREEDRALAGVVRRYAKPTALLWFLRRALRISGQVKDGVAFTAIAHPREFFKQLDQAGAVIATTLSWPDHHRYTLADTHKLTKRARELRAGAFVTTAKDAVKLNPAMRAALEHVAPLVVAHLTLELKNEHEALASILRVLHSTPHV